MKTFIEQINTFNTRLDQIGVELEKAYVHALETNKAIRKMLGEVVPQSEDEESEITTFIHYIRHRNRAQASPGVIPFSGWWWDQDAFLQRVSAKANSAPHHKQDLRVFFDMMLRHEVNEFCIRDALPLNNKEVMQILYENIV
jgi:hypothetical protein